VGGSRDARRRKAENQGNDQEVVIRYGSMEGEGMERGGSFWFLSLCILLV